jgi:transcriptional regulator with XRE-family HTH domain
MRENVTGIRGEFRELTPKEIGDFVWSMRKLRETKRLVLAQEAGISEKSLERLESGVRVSDEVYRKVALAVGQKEDAFLGPRYISTQEETIKKAIENLEKLESDHKKWEAENLLIDANPFNNEHDMRRF